MITIDADLLAKAEKLARQKGVALSVLVEEALCASLRQQGESTELYGEPLTEEEIKESARVTFGMLDQEEDHAAQGIAVSQARRVPGPKPRHCPITPS